MNDYCDSTEEEDNELVESLCEIDEGLSEWEVEFVESLSKWLEWNATLTAKQRTKALQIFEEKG